MIDFSQLLIILAIIVQIINLLYYLFFIVFTDDVMLKPIGSTILDSLLVAVFMIFLCCIYGYIYSIRLLDMSIGIGIFVSSILLVFFNNVAIGRYRFMRERTKSVMKALIGVIEAGNSNLDGHSLHVMNLTMLLYRNLPFKYRIKINPDNLQYASLLFDVGKLGVPKEIIDKQGKLDSEEWAFIRRHPDIGATILGDIPCFDRICEWIKYHHEHVDGSGYYHLKGEEIPLASRIIAIADTYSAITMNRNYKSSKTYGEAIAEIKIVSGSQLDENLVHFFCNIPKQKIEDSINEVKINMDKYSNENFR